MESDVQFPVEDVAAFTRDEAVGWIAPDGRIVPTPLHGHLEALRNNADLAGMLPLEINWDWESSDLMEALYEHGWGRIGTFGSLAGFAGFMELECFVEFLPALEKRAKAMAEILERQLRVSPVFTREDRLAWDIHEEEIRFRKQMRGEPLAAIAAGHAVGWISPEGGLRLAHPKNPVGFLRHAIDPVLSSVRKRLQALDSHFEAWQSAQFAEGLDPDEHPEWHRFYALPYPCHPDVAEPFMKAVLAKGWGYLERAPNGGIQVSAAVDAEGVARRVEEMAESLDIRCVAKEDSLGPENEKGPARSL